MDPVAMIVTALAAGAAAALKETAGTAIKDGYAALRAIVREKLGGHPDAQAAVDQNDRLPGSAAAELAERLSDTPVAQDANVLEAAVRLMALVDPTGSASGKYVVDVSGGQGVNVGDHNIINQNFTTRD